MNRSLLATAAAVLMLGGCATIGAPERPPLALDEVVAMAKAGKDANAIIAEIKARETAYDVTASQYAKLSRDGVPDAVLDFMQAGQIRMAERIGRREAQNDLWLHGPGWFGYGPIWRPRAYVVYVRGRPYYQNW